MFFDNVEVPAENLIGEENKGWTYAKHLLSHERTNIADVNRAKRELERLKRIAKAEGVYDDQRFRDEIASSKSTSSRSRCWCCACCRPRSRGKNALDIAGLLKIKGSEIQQRYTELMMLAAGPFALPFIHEAMEAGWQGDYRRRRAICAPLAGNLLQHAQDHDLRRLATKCNATSSRRRCWAERETEHGLQFHRRPGTAARRRRAVGRQGLRLRAPPRHRQGGRLRRATSTANWPNSA